MIVLRHEYESGQKEKETGSRKKLLDIKGHMPYIYAHSR
jgi:hypothetical protein